MSTKVLAKVVASVLVLSLLLAEYVFPGDVFVSSALTWLLFGSVPNTAPATSSSALPSPDSDDDTKRAYESSDDAYRVFRRMLKEGRPPDNWDALLGEALAERERLRGIAGKTADDAG